MTLHGARRAALAVALVCAAVGTAACQRPEASRRASNELPDTGARPAARTDAAAPRSDAYVPAAPPGPTGTVEATVYLDGPIRREPEITVPAAFAARRGCRDAARRYSQPFDITEPGVFPGALVHVEARESSQAPERDVRITFRDCDITPRFTFATSRDRIFLHSDTRETHIPSIVGSGAAIDQLLIPGQDDVRRVLPGPGRYPVTVRNLPEFVGAVIFVLPNRFIATTDITGVGRVTEVPVGRRTVRAWYPGTIEAREIVEVQAGQTSRVTFHLRQSPPAPAQPAQPVDAGEYPPK